MHMLSPPDNSVTGLQPVLGANEVRPIPRRSTTETDYNIRVQTLTNMDVAFTSFIGCDTELGTINVGRSYHDIGASEASSPLDSPGRRTHVHSTDEYEMRSI
jgi:hypothetical protein